MKLPQRMDMLSPEARYRTLFRALTHNERVDEWERRSHLRTHRNGSSISAYESGPSPKERINIPTEEIEWAFRYASEGRNLVEMATMARYLGRDDADVYAGAWRIYANTIPVREYRDESLRELERTGEYERAAALALEQLQTVRAVDNILKRGTDHDWRFAVAFYRVAGMYIPAIALAEKHNDIDLTRELLEELGNFSRLVTWEDQHQTTGREGEYRLAMYKRLEKLFPWD